MPESGRKLATRDMPLPLMATHLSSFPRSSLLKGGKVPRQEI
jgi:hypothetical protein